MGAIELVVILVVIYLLWQTRGVPSWIASASLPANPTTQRVVAAAAGVIETFVLAMPNVPGTAGVVRNALLWWLTYEVLRFFRHRLRRSLIALYFILVLVLQRAVGILLAYLQSAVWPASGFARSTLEESAIQMLSVSGYTASMPLLVTTLVVFLLLYAMITQSLSPGHGAPTPTESNSYGGVDMTSGINHATRYLCASAVLSGSAFRMRVLRRLNEWHTAPAPELGVDLPLVARVCAAMERREQRFDGTFIALALVAFVFSAAVPDFSPGINAAIWLVLAIVYYRKTTTERRELAVPFSANAFSAATVEAKLPDVLSDREVDALPPEGQNVVVYRGFQPFLGAGIELGGLSLTVDTSRPKPMCTAEDLKTVRTTDLYAAIEDECEALAIPGMVVRDFLFANGADLRECPDLLDDCYARPQTRVDPAVVERYLDRSDSRIRRYKWITIHGWGSDIVFSYFIRCTMSGPTLFVEVNRYVLPPLADAYREIDRLRPMDFREFARRAGVSLIMGPLSVLLALLSVAQRASAAWGDFRNTESRRRRAIDQDPSFNYGADESLRESFAGKKFVHYYQRVDLEGYTRLLDREFLETLCEFLESCNVETADLRQGQTTILNSGIIVQRGDVRAESLAVGSGAQATKAAPARAVR